VDNWEAHRLQLCLDAVQTALIASEHKTAMAEAAAAEA
jgi:hypothetical protein